MLTLAQIGAIVTLLMAFEVPHVTIQEVERTLLGTRTAVVQDVAPAVIDTVTNKPTCRISSQVIEWETGGIRTPHSTPTATPYRVRLEWEFNGVGARAVANKYPGTVKHITVDGEARNAQIADVMFPTASTLTSTTTDVAPYYNIYGLEFSNGTSCYTYTK